MRKRLPGNDSTTSLYSESNNDRRRTGELRSLPLISASETFRSSSAVMMTVRLPRSARSAGNHLCKISTAWKGFNCGMFASWYLVPTSLNLCKPHPCGKHKRKSHQECTFACTGSFPNNRQTTLVALFCKRSLICAQIEVGNELI